MKPKTSPDGKTRPGKYYGKRVLTRFRTAVRRRHGGRWSAMRAGDERDGAGGRVCGEKTVSNGARGGTEEFTVRRGGGGGVRRRRLPRVGSGARVPRSGCRRGHEAGRRGPHTRGVPSRRRLLTGRTTTTTTKTRTVPRASVSVAGAPSVVCVSVAGASVPVPVDRVRVASCRRSVRVRRTLRMGHAVISHVWILRTITIIITRV